jgi:hypothetical protein
MSQFDCENVKFVRVVDAAVLNLFIETHFSVLMTVFRFSTKARTEKVVNPRFGIYSQRYWQLPRQQLYHTSPHAPKLPRVMGQLERRAEAIVGEVPCMCVLAVGGSHAEPLRCTVEEWGTGGVVGGVSTNPAEVAPESKG